MRGLNLSEKISFITLAPFDLERPIRQDNTREGAYFQGVSHDHTARGRGPALTNFGRSLLFMRTLFDAERPNLSGNTYVCEGPVSEMTYTVSSGMIKSTIPSG